MTETEAELISNHSYQTLYKNATGVSPDTNQSKIFYGFGGNVNNYFDHGIGISLTDDIPVLIKYHFLMNHHKGKQTAELLKPNKA